MPQPDARVDTYSNNAVFPTPASPHRTTTRLSPVLTPAISPSSASHSLRRPRSLATSRSDIATAEAKAGPRGGQARVRVGIRSSTYQRNGLRDQSGRRPPTPFVTARVTASSNAERAGRAPGARKPRHAGLTKGAALQRIMRPGRLELPRDIRPTRPSTLRVYQFRHRRVRVAQYRADFGSSGRRLDAVRPLAYSANTCSI